MMEEDEEDVEELDQLQKEYFGKKNEDVDDENKFDSSDEEDFLNVLYNTRSEDLEGYIDEQDAAERPLIVKPVKFPPFVQVVRKINVLYELVVCMTLFTTVFLTTYAAFFKFYEDWISKLELITDVLFSVDIIIRLGVEIWRCHTKCPYKVFLVNYTFFLGLMDIIALLPLEYLFMVILDDNVLSNVELIDYFGVVKSFRFYRIIRFFDKLGEDLRSNQRAIAVTRYVLVYVLILHSFTCSMFFLCGTRYLDWLLYRVQEVDDSGNHSCYLRLRKHKASPPEGFESPFPESWAIYIFTLEFITAIITTVGFGDVYPMNNGERALTVVIMLVGAVWISGDLSSTLTSFILEKDAARYSLFYRRNGISHHIADHHGSGFIDTKIRAYYQYLWNYREGIHEIKLQGMPDCMQEDIKFDICEEMFYKSPLFRDLEDTFLHTLAKQAEVRLLNPGILVIEQSTICQEMYYVLQGELGLINEVDDDHTSIIFRAGCTLGEVNLFNTLPYEHTVYTRTVCQLLVISKESLLTMLKNNPHIYTIMRQRIANRRRDLRNGHIFVHLHPLVKAVYRRDDEEMKGITKDIDLEGYPVTIRNSTGLNRLVKGDILLDLRETYIVEMPCTKKEFQKIQAKSYREVLIPEILSSDSLFLRCWNACTLVFWLMLCMATPFCVTFEDYTRPYNLICSLMSSRFYLMILINFVDLAVEVAAACPSSGIRFKLLDGYHMKKGQLSFYCDLITLIPIELVYGSWFLPIFRTGIKTWKIFRFWSYCDNRFPLHLFMIRLCKILVIFFFAIYCTSMALLWIICPDGIRGKCKDVTWFDKDYPFSRKERLQTGYTADESFIITTLMFAAASVTSVGFGDVSPNTTEEMIWLIIVMALGAFLVSYCLAEMTSALSALFKPELIFNQKLQAASEFMSQQGLTERMTGRVVEHYKLSHELLKQCILPPGRTHLMFDSPKDLLEDILVTETESYFDGVPVFSKVNADIIIRIAHGMKRYLVPPGITFVKRGEVRRQLYVVVRGWVGLYEKDAEQPLAIYRSTAHFGLRDLLYGQPYQCNVKTLSHVVLYMIDYPIFEEMFKEDEEFLRFVSKQKEMLKHTIASQLVKYYEPEDRSDEAPCYQPSWIRYASHPDEQILRGCTDFADFERPFLHCEGAWLLRRALMPSTIHPNGAFSKVWSVFIGIVALLNTALLFIESYMGYRSPTLRVIQFVVDVIFSIDIYLRCHMGYEEFGQIWYHPLKTCIHYVFEGLFFIDIFVMVPCEMIIYMMGATDILGYGPGFSWYTMLRWVRITRLYRFTELFVLVHKTFINRSFLFFVFYLALSVIISTFLGAVACQLACPTYSHKWEEGDEYKFPACKKESWIRKKFLDTKNLINETGGVQVAGYGVSPADFKSRWVLMVYYVGQVLMVIGFGDLVTNSPLEMEFLLVVGIFGFLTMQIMISDMTAAQVDSDEVRAKSREELNRMIIVLSREGAPNKFIRAVKAHFNLQWCYTKGMQPRDLLSDLHPILESDVFVEYVGDVFDRVPIFRGFSSSIIHSMCKFMKKEYFSRGEIITRYGNMEFEFFVIAGGTVYVTDSQDKWIGTLTIGETLGEMSLIYSSKRLYSAYAATTIEVFTLSSFDFAELLDRYPSIRETVIGALKRNKRDTFLIKAWKLKAEDPKKYSDEQQKRTEELATFIKPYELHVNVEGAVKLSEKEKFHPEPGYWSTIYGYGSDDLVDNYYIYFASETPKKFNFVLHPNCKFVSHVLFLVKIVRYFLPCIALYNVCFYTDDPVVNDKETTQIVQSVLYFFDAIYYFYMILQLFTAWEVDNRKCYCKTSKKLVIHYLLSPDLFLLDLLAIFPYHFVTGDHGTVLLLFRCILLIEYFNTLIVKGEDIEVSTFQHKLSISLSLFVLMAHFFACLFFWVSCRNTKITSCRVDSWVVMFKTDRKKIGLDFVNPKPSYWYAISLYWVVTTLTTTGFGDISPTNIHEVIIAILCVFFGAFSLSIILGNITTGLASLYRAEREFFYFHKIVINYLRSIGLSARGQDILAAYVTMQWHNCRGANYNDSVTNLSSSLRVEAYVALYHKCVTHCLIFGSGYDLVFIRNVCSRMEHVMLLPGMKIANELEPTIGLHIVLRGCVTSYQLNPLTGKNEFRKKYDQFTAFGKLPALFPDTLYNKSYRAEGRAEVVIIKHAEIRRLLRSFPRWRAFLRGIIKLRYEEFVKNTGIKSIVKKRRKPPATKRIIVEDLLNAQEILTAV